MNLDRVAIAQALAKAQAFKQCGKQAEAEAWAAELVRLLQCADILKVAA
jgi:biotin synthase-related radical SAM superfamily protein